MNDFGESPSFVGSNFCALFLAHFIVEEKHVQFKIELLWSSIWFHGSISQIKISQAILNQLVCSFDLTLAVSLLVLIWASHLVSGLSATTVDSKIVILAVDNSSLTLNSLPADLLKLNFVLRRSFFQDHAWLSVQCTLDAMGNSPSTEFTLRTCKKRLPFDSVCKTIVLSRRV